MTERVVYSKLLRESAVGASWQHAVNENHSGTIFLKKVRNIGIASLSGLGLVEPKSGR